MSHSVPPRLPGFERNGKIRACAVGCTLDVYDHSRYPVELGLPEWLAYLEDSIHEGLTLAQAKKWPARFLTAIKPGIDVVFDDNMPPGILAQSRPTVSADLTFITKDTPFVPILRSRLQLRHRLHQPSSRG